MSGRRKLLIFVAKVFILILIFASFWPFVAPSYTNLLVAVTNGIAPSTISLTADDSLIVIQHMEQLASLSLHSLPFQAGLLLVLALIIATPGLKIKRRLLYVAAGAILTFILHIVSLLIMTTNVRAMRPLIVLFASVGIDLFPVLIWAALSAKYWWPKASAPSSSP